MKVFFDLDDTLIRTGEIKEGLRELFRNPDGADGMTFSDEEIDTAYRAVYKEGYEGPMAQLDCMWRSIRKFDLDKANERLDTMLDECVSPEIVYEDVLNYLLKLRDEGHDIYLVTVGNPWYQRQKAEKSGVESIVGSDRCIYTEDAKHDEIRKYLDNSEEQFIFVEDKDSTIGAVRESHPNAIIVKAENGSLREIHNQELSQEFMPSSEIAAT